MATWIINSISAFCRGGRTGGRTDGQVITKISLIKWWHPWYSVAHKRESSAFVFVVVVFFFTLGSVLSIKADLNGSSRYTCRRPYIVVIQNISIDSRPPKPLWDAFSTDSVHNKAFENTMESHVVRMLKKCAWTFRSSISFRCVALDRLL